MIWMSILEMQSRGFHEIDSRNIEENTQKDENIKPEEMIEEWIIQITVSAVQVNISPNYDSKKVLVAKALQNTSSQPGWFISIPESKRSCKTRNCLTSTEIRGRLSRDRDPPIDLEVYAWKLLQQASVKGITINFLKEGISMKTLW